MVEAAVGIRMVASQLLLMNHFLMSLSHNTADLSSIHDINSVAVDPSECSYGCTLCSPINGCLACKPPFFLSLHREGVRQTATCTRSCPKGFYKLKKKRNGFCAKCTIRGCADCLDSRYCSTCEASFVNFFGKCIKHKSEEAREDLGMYTTTRRPAGDYIPPAGPWSPTKNNVTLLFSQLPLAVNTSGPPEDSLTTSALPPTVTATPLPDVGATTEFIRRRSKTSKPGHMGAAPDLSTRFYFTTPTSPLLSGEPTSAISPYPTQSPVFPPPESPCRVRGDRKPYGRPRTNRKERKERRGRKKDRDRKFRRRKGRRGKKNRRYGCKSRSKAKKDISSAPPSQDPAMRQKNSVSDGERRTGDPYPYHDVRPSEDAKVSLFDDSNSSALSDGGSATDLPHHFRNRPRDMVAYKTSLVARRRSEAREEAETLYQNGRRLRHGRSRGILSDGEDADRNSSGKKIPQTKSARRRRRRRRRKRRKEERNVNRRSQFPSHSTLEA